MKFDFDWKIVSSDDVNKTFVVTYTRKDNNIDYTYTLNTPIDTTVNIQAYIERHAPQNVWNNDERQPLLSSHVNTTGTTVVIESMADIRLKRLDEIALWRYNQEIGGVNVGSSVISTTRESQNLVNNAYTSLKDGILTVVNFKTDTGEWVALGLPEITGIATAVANHVQSCFNREKLMINMVNDSFISFLPSVPTLDELIASTEPVDAPVV